MADDDPFEHRLSDLYNWLGSPRVTERKALLDSLKDRQAKLIQEVAKREEELAKVTLLIELIVTHSELAQDFITRMESLGLLK